MTQFIFQEREQICDVCNRSTSWGEGTVYTADEFRTLVFMGFEMDEGMLRFMTTGVGGMPRTRAIAYWKQQAANSTTGWLLCPSCAARAAKYMPKPAGTGPGSSLLSAPTTRSVVSAVTQPPTPETGRGTKSSVKPKPLTLTRAQKICNSVIAATMVLIAIVVFMSFGFNFYTILLALIVTFLDIRLITRTIKATTKSGTRGVTAG